MKNIPINPFQFAIHISKPHKKWAVTALIFVFAGSILTRLLIVFFKNLTDSIVSAPYDIDTIFFWSFAYPALYFTAEAVWRGSGFSGMRWFTSMNATGYKVLYKYLTGHSKDYFNSRFAGSLTNKISNAVDGVEIMLHKFLWRFLPLFLTISLYLVVSWAANWKLGLTIAIWTTVFLTINFYLVRKLQPYAYKSAQTQSTLKGRLVDSLSNISTVQEHGFLPHENQYIHDFIEKQRKAGYITWYKNEWILITNGILITIFIAVMIYLSIGLYLNELITVGSVVMTITMVTDLTNSLFFIGMEMGESTKLYGRAKEGLNEILKKYNIVEQKGAKPLKISKGHISIENLSFDYDQTSVFQNFSLMIKPGERVGLVGRSGAGKSTLISLLLRHFDPLQGQIKIDNQNIKSVTLASLRQNIAFVPQDTSLFHRSINDNISYSMPDAPFKSIQKAARLAQADEFIEKLPKGFKTLVGERGVKLSGGQRQRIAIARAFLKNSPILILDEATSSLDTHSEQLVQKALLELMKNRTVIAIAHRLSTLKNMDRIIIIENGTIVEDDSPNKLLAKKTGIFTKLWNQQIKGFIMDEEDLQDNKN